MCSSDLVDAPLNAKWTALPEGSVKPQKYPSLSVGANGSLLVTWSEGAGWQKNGGLAWQLLGPDLQGKDSPSRSKAGGIAVWSFPSAVPRGDGFAIYR